MAHISNKKIGKELKKARQSFDETYSQKAQQPLEAYIAEHFAHQTAANQATAPQPKKIKFTPKLATLTATLLIIVIGVAIALAIIFPLDSGILPKEYFLDDENNREVSLSYLNTHMQHILFALNDDDVDSLILVYDEPSGDYLCFVINFKFAETDRNAEIRIVINEFYDNKPTLSVGSEFELKTATINGFVVEYTEYFIPTSGIFRLESRALIDTGSETVFIIYNSYSATQQNTMLIWLQQSVEAKN
jgi:hypothetical protein